MLPPGDSPDIARAESLAAWLREQRIPRRAQAALLRDLQRVNDGLAGDAESRLRGLDRDGFVAQLHMPDGGAVATVIGVGAKTLAALRRALPLLTGQAPAHGAGGAGAEMPVATVSVPAPASAAVLPEPTPSVGVGTGASTASSDPKDTLAELTAAADGLLVPSESDHPFTPFRWEGSGPITPGALLAYLGLPPETPVEVRSLESFFAPLSQAADWMDDHERAQAARFAALRDYIAAALSSAAVYCVGQTVITVIIVGQDVAGRSVGLRTTVVET